MLLYNIAVVSLLCYARIGSGKSGVGLRPAVILHSALAVWCVACVRTTRRNVSGGGANGGVGRSQVRSPRPKSAES
jgi:hypothetical protein